MKGFVVGLICVVSMTTTYGQGGKGKISGQVIDNASQHPIEFATVALRDPETNKPVNGALCDGDGKFTITQVANGNWKLVVSFIGYETIIIDVSISDERSAVEITTLKLASTSKELDAVVIEGQRSLVEEKVDRTVYNAENDATAAGGDATDVLRRVPMLSVDMDGNVSLRGNQNIRVLINNKPSTITASSVADALKQIPADQIKSVEVITSPSAKYDAEGSAGIINIITKKNTMQGLTFNVDGSAGYRGSNLGLNGNYRTGKMGFSLGGFSRSSYNVDGKFTNRQLTTTAAGLESLNLQQADTRRNNLFGNMTLGWDYDINKKNYVAASIRYGVRNGNSYQDNLTTQIYQNSLLTTSSLRDVDVADQSGTMDVNFNYTRQFAKPQQEFSVLAQYSLNNRTNDFVNAILNESDLSVTSRLRNDNKSFNQETTVQADYMTPIGKTQLLEFGGKAIQRKVSSDYAYLEATGASGPYIPATNSNLANIFTYNQDITAGYLSYTYSMKSGYSFKVGSRYEYTAINANFANEKGSVIIPSYHVVVPSINLSKRLENGNTIKLAYNRRIQRPSIQYLNPNIQASNPYAITVGNPNLGPEFTNNYELSYSTSIKSTSLNISTFVRNTYDALQSIRSILGNNLSDPDTLITNFQNIGREDAYGSSIFANVNISSKLTMNFGTDFFYAVLRNNDPSPLYTATNHGWVSNFRVFGNYSFTKGWALQFFSFYRGRQVQLQGYQGNFYVYSLSVRREFANKKGSMGIGAEQFFTPAMRIDNSTNSPVIAQNSTNELYNVNFKVTFSYRIGKMSFDAPRRRRRSINNDDLKEGGESGVAEATQAQSGNSAGAPRQAPIVAPVAAQVLPPANPDVVVVVEGKWSYTIESPQGGSGTLTIKKEGEKFIGSSVNSRTNRETIIQSFNLVGNELTYTYEVSFGGNTSTITVKSIVEGDAMTGTMSVGQFGSFPIKATRVP